MLALGNAPLIPAGSLFTSCIEQVEPLGIQDMRFAKAEYIRALKDLRAADAEYVRAQAAFELARARYKDAQTANLNADTEYQKLLNEYQQLINEARQDTNDFIHNATISAIDSLKKEIELRELTHAKAMVDAERELAQAKEELRVALRNISLAAGDLTGPEKVALAEAVAVYYGLTEEVIKQEYRVFKAQQKVDTLTEYALRFADTAWNGYALVDMDDYYEDAIEWEEAKIAKWMEDYEAIPDSSARVAEWKAYVDRFADRENKLNYELAKIEAEETAITSLMKEGIRDFNMAIAEFIEENWNEKPAGTFTEPTEPDKPGTEPKPTDDDYNVENFFSDSLKFAAFPKGDISPASFNKFGYLLSSYVQESPYSKSEPKNNIIDTVMNGANFDTIFIVGPVKQDMKAFILGAAGNGENSQKGTFNEKEIKANYGLWGAYDILEREYVTKQKEAKTAEQIAGFKKNMEAKDSIWTAHSNILKNGLTKYEPYTTALAKYKSAVETNDANKAEMVAAIDNMMTQIERSLTGTNNAANFRYDDSLALFDAMVRFAKAREAYLDYAFDPEGSETFNRDYFYYASGTDSHGKVIVDSVLFSALSFDALRANDYDKDASKTTLTNFVTTESTRQFGLANIANQLFNETVATALLKATFSAPAVGDVMTKDAALYNMYTYDPATKTLNYAEMPEVAEAKKAVLAAVASFVDVYNQFWGYEDANGNVHRDSKNKPDGSVFDTDYNAYFDETSATAKATKLATAEGKVEIKDETTQTLKYLPTYSLATFKPYSDEDKTPIVTFTGTAVDETPAVLAILTSVDPACTDRTNNVFFKGNMDASILHKTGTTSDLYNAMKAEYDYWAATTEVVVKDLEAIKKWIEGVEATFTADAEAAPGEATKAYNDDHKDWETTKKNYDTKKAAYDEYVAAKKAFTGTRTVSGKTVINPVYNAAASYPKPITPAFLTDVKALFATNLVGEYVGWIETLGGKQLENAIKAFGEKPWEQFNEWNKTKAQYNAQKTDLAGLKIQAVNVFKAEAKMEGYDRVASAADFEAAYKAYVQAYKALRDAIVVYDEFGNIDMNNTEAKVNKAMQEIERLSHEAACYKSDVPDWEGLIAEAQKDLKVQEARLQSLKTACEYAKANYEKLKEYILSQDASYVIPVSVADIQSLLKGLGIDINALIGTYLGIEEEVEPVVEP